MHCKYCDYSPDVNSIYHDGLAVYKGRRTMRYEGEDCICQKCYDDIYGDDDDELLDEDFDNDGL